ncbi:MAG: hypothetical protein Kow0065_11280 [Methylomicrobium sp.]
MSTPFKKALFVFLAVLQSIAPLVHAHPVDDGRVLGVHVPGLEQFSVDRENDVLALLEQVVIDLDQGIENGDRLTDDIADYCAVFLVVELPSPTLRLSFEVAFSPHFRLPDSRPASSPQAPRAPPVPL